MHRRPFVPQKSCSGLDPPTGIPRPAANMMNSRETQPRVSEPSALSMPAPRLRRRRDLAATAVVFLLAFAIYWPALHAGFIWDDDAHVTRVDLRSLEGLGRIWFEPGATQQYYPLLHSAFWLEHRLWGDSPLGYHLV